MASGREELFCELFRRLYAGSERRICKCINCPNLGPMLIRPEAIDSEACDGCGQVAWRDLTEKEFASETRKSDLLNLHSDYLASKIEDVYLENPEPAEWMRIQKKLVGCLEGFGDADLSEWVSSSGKENPTILEFLLDEYYTRDFLSKVRKVVQRTMKLETMTPKATPDREVNLHLREATRCWIFGFWDSSVALSRATLERALKNRLKNAGLLPSDDKLEKLVEAAHLCRLIDGAHVEMAERVRLNGNEVLHHDSAADEGRARDTLFCTRGILNELYSQ